MVIEIIGAAATVITIFSAGVAVGKHIRKTTAQAKVTVVFNDLT